MGIGYGGPDRTFARIWKERERLSMIYLFVLSLNETIFVEQTMVEQTMVAYPLAPFIAILVVAFCLGVMVTFLASLHWRAQNRQLWWDRMLLVQDDLLRQAKINTIYMHTIERLSELESDKQALRRILEETGFIDLSDENIEKAIKMTEV